MWVHIMILNSKELFLLWSISLEYIFYNILILFYTHGSENIGESVLPWDNLKTDISSFFFLGKDYGRNESHMLFLTF